MEPSAKEFQDSDRGEPPGGVGMFVLGFSPDLKFGRIPVRKS